MTDNQAIPGGDDRTGASSPMPEVGAPPRPGAAVDPASIWARPAAAAAPNAPSEPRTPQVGSAGYPSYAPPSYAPPPAGAATHGAPPPYQGSPSASAPYGAATPHAPDGGHTAYQPYQQTWQIPLPQAPQPLGEPRPPLLTPVVRKRLVAAGAALAIALTAGGVGGFVGYALHPDGLPLQISAVTGNGHAAPVIDRSSLASIAAALQPTIVDITTNSGEGSGVVISADGNIVTNNHVVEGARSVRVTFNSGRSVPGTVVGTDPKTDLAVVKVDATDLTFATWGDSDAVQVGDTVLAIGSPLGLQGSVTAGIVSALHRTITVSGNQRQQDDSTTTIGDAIQTDAAINPGNSGGALVNTNGEVIGINTAIATSSSASGNIGVGFAISANRAKAVTNALAAGQRVSHPYVGVRISNADSGGAIIEGVVNGSPADQAGLRAGDVVIKVGDRTIRGAEDLIGAIQASTVGQTLPVTVMRDGSEKTFIVTVGDQ